MIEDIVALLAQFFAVMFVISFHEYAHAYAAYKNGDPTAKFSGRMTLNPMKHFDPLGIIMFALAGFGWAKPVPVNPYNFKDLKKGSIWTSVAGVLVNYATAFLAYPLLLLMLRFLYPILAGKYLGLFLYRLLYCCWAYSLSFCVFNLLPFYPLDGFRLVEALSEGRGKVYRFLRQYGYYILLGLIFLNILSSRIYYFDYFNVLGYFMSFAVNVLGKPISLLWDWIFGFIF